MVTTEMNRLSYAFPVQIFFPVHLIFKDEYAWLLQSMHHERVPPVQDGAITVSGVERHQRVRTLNLRGKARE
jgi:hypothetical protein